MFWIYFVNLSLFFITGSHCTNPAAEKCDIPGGKKGTCVDVSLCEQYNKVLNARPLLHAEYLRHVQCRFNGSMSNVCCPAKGENYVFADLKVPKEKRKRVNLLANRFGTENELEVGCGEAPAPDRILGGVVTNIDEFPWMALMVYERKHSDGRPVLACGGVLINKRYVLTAAHCVYGPGYKKLGGLFKVRLGEYNIEEEEDCNIEEDYRDCADPIMDVEPELIIVHPDYDPVSKDQYNDIALVRLKKEIKYTEFIRPICLPDSNVEVRIGDYLTVAGWGKTENATESNSPIKLKLGLPVVERDSCQTTYSKFGIALSKKQICAGGQMGRDSCKGDSGGPLMTQLPTGAWVACGVVSIGPERCGQSLVPGLYTDVRDYVAWINQNITP